MKGIFVIIDGVADRACRSLGDNTPLQVAKTINLDWFAEKGEIEHCYGVKEGVAPESSSAVISLLGYDASEAPRGPLEALGAGIKLTNGDLAIRINFATVDNVKDGNLLDSRAGRTLTTKEARKLAKAINENVKLPFKFELHSTIQHRGILVFRGGFSDNISNADPHYSGGMVSANSADKIVFSYALDEEDDSKLSAELLNNFLRQSHEILENHPVNIARKQKGLFPANWILARDAGNEKLRFKKLKGKWMALGYMPLEKGIAGAAGMKVWSFAYPEMRDFDAYANLFNGLNKAIDEAIKMLKKNEKKYDYFYIHFKEPDVPGHDNKPREKVKMIELIDEKFFSFLRKFIKNRKVIVTADHTTASGMKRHTEDPVPVLVFTGRHEGGRGKRFTEKEGLKGKKIMGRKLLERYLFGK